MSTDLSCQQLVEQLTDYLEGELDPQAVGSIEAHLADCPGCDAALQHLRVTVEALGQSGRPRLSDQVRQELVEEFRRSIS